MMFKLLKRTTETAVKLPFAMAWDLISLGNMGDGASTSKVLREHEAKKQLDDLTEIIERVREIGR
jgi:hypothetical protein